jgi:ketosteroid isomerase-like protein
VRDLIPPAVARNPVEAIEIVSLAISDGDLEAALAQYEDSAVLRPWQWRPADGADPGRDLAGAGNAAGGLRDVMELRLPLAVRMLAVLPTGDQALVLAERRISGAGPDGERVELTGSGAAIVRRQPGGGWRIAADAWCLAGTGGPDTEPDGFPRDSP